MTLSNLNENDGDGKLKQLVITVKCDRCNGYGFIGFYDTEGEHRNECNNCSGSGLVDKIIECYGYYEM